MSESDHPNIKRQSDGWPLGVSDEQKEKLVEAARVALTTTGRMTAYSVYEHMRHSGIREPFGALIDYNCAVADRACRGAGSSEGHWLDPTTYVVDVLKAGRNAKRRKTLMAVAELLRAEASDDAEDDSVLCALLRERVLGKRAAAPQNDPNGNRDAAHARILRQAAEELGSLVRAKK